MKRAIKPSDRIRSKKAIFLFSVPFFFGVLVASFPLSHTSKSELATKSKNPFIPGTKPHIGVGSCLIEKRLCNINEDLDPWQYYCDLNERLQITKVGKHSYKTTCKPLDGFLQELSLDNCSQLSTYKPFLSKADVENYLTINCDLTPKDFGKE